MVDWGYYGFGVTAVPSRATNVVDVAAGGNHALALRGDGTIVGWGNNLSGQINIPVTASNLVAVAAGLNHSLALRANGTLMAWGDASHGQSNIPRPATNIIAIACGDNHSLALRSDGAVFAWGDNTYGQATVPVGTSNMVAVAATGFGSMALVGDGPPVITTPLVDRVVLSGANAPLRVAAVGTRPLYYQWLLNGNAVLGATNSILLVTNVQSDNAGLYSVVVSNALGVATSSQFSLNLVPLVITTQPGSQSVLAGSDVSFTVAAGGQNPIEFHWLFNGEPLDGATNSTLSVTNVQPAQAGGYAVVVTNASCVLTSSMAVLRIVPLAITAQPQSQSVPMGSTVSFSVTAAMQGPFSYQWFFGGTALPDGTANPLVLSNVQPEQAGSYSVQVSNQWGTTNSANATLSVLDLDAWGSNSDGQGVVPAGLTNVLGIASGYYHNVALKSDGSVLAWGSWSFGATYANQVPGLTNVVGVGAASDDSIALKGDGTVIVWGYNIDGEGNVPLDLTNAVAATGGESHLLALRSDGTVTAWGKDDYGQTNVPPGLSNAVAVAAGGAHSVALRRDGTVVAWGRNDVGQCTVPADLTNVIAIGAGYLHTIALKDDGTIVAWGGNDYGQTNVPVGLSNVVAIAGGVWHNLALLNDGSVTAWGRNDYGQSTIPPGLRAVAISAGDFHSLALASTTPPILQALVSAPALSNGVFSLNVPTQSGRVYELEYKHSLDETNWTVLPLVAGSGRPEILTDPTADGAQRFYRIRRW